MTSQLAKVALQCPLFELVHFLVVCTRTGELVACRLVTVATTSVVVIAPDTGLPEHC